MERIEFTRDMANALVASRISNGYSQYTLAERLGTPRASIKRWECYEVKTIPRNILKRIEANLGPLTMPSVAAADESDPKPDPKPKKAVKKKTSDSPDQFESSGLVSETSKIVRHRIQFEKHYTVNELLGKSALISTGKTVISGTIVGVECSKSQYDKGIRKGHACVLALLK